MEYLIFSYLTLLFVSPGILIWGYTFPNSERSETVFYGSILGVSISCLTCSVSLLFFKIQYITMVLIFIISILLVFRVIKKPKIPLLAEPIRLSHGDKIIFCFAIILSIALVIGLYWSFGIKTQHGFMFKDLHATDTSHHLSTIIYLSKSRSFPPQNPYVLGESWHYYWISHLLPAVAYGNFSALQKSPKVLFLLTCLLYTCLFVSSLFLLLKVYVKNLRTLLLILLMALLAFGYNDLFLLIKWLINNIPYSIADRVGLIRLISENGTEYTGYSHGWTRNFVMTPPSTLALSLFFIVMAQNKRFALSVRTTSFYFITGGLLALAFCMDAFIGTIGILWYFSFLVYSLYSNKAFKPSMMIMLLVWSIPIGISFCALYYLHIMGPGSSHLIFKPYAKMVYFFPFYFIIDFGPSGILCLYGISWLKKHKLGHKYVELYLLFLLSIIFMLFFNISEIGTTQMFRKGAMVLRIPTILFAGISIEYFLSHYGRKGLLIIVLACMIAIPTPICDIYMLADSGKAKPSNIVTLSNYEAYIWLKKALPDWEVVQDYPSDMTPLLFLAEKRVALGDWEHAKSSSGIRFRGIMPKFKEIVGIFKTTNALESYRICQSDSIQYILVDERTRQKFKVGCAKFDKYKQLFMRVYNRLGVSIYKVVK